MEDSIFTKILKREIRAEIIYEDDFVFVIPDKFPSMHGQLLVITKRQAPYVFELSDEEYAGLMSATKLIARACDKAFETVRTCIVLEGFEVPHVHVRVYPCKKEELTWERYEASDAELSEVADRVRAAFA